MLEDDKVPPRLWRSLKDTVKTIARELAISEAQACEALADAGKDGQITARGYGPSQRGSIVQQLILGDLEIRTLDTTDWRGPVIWEENRVERFSEVEVRVAAVKEWWATMSLPAMRSRPNDNYETD